MSVTPQKKCTHCKEVKPLEDFSPNKRGRMGRQAWCKACIREAVSRLRHEGNPSYETHKANVRARRRAFERLAEHHHDEYESILLEERIAEGLPAIKWERAS